MDAPASQTSHKHVGVDGSFSGTEAFSPIPGRISCSSQDRQHDGGGVYQLPRGYAFVATAQSSAQADCLEHRTLQLTARDAHPGSPECWGRSPVVGKPIIRRMGTPPTGGESHLNLRTERGISPSFPTRITQGRRACLECCFGDHSCIYREGVGSLSRAVIGRGVIGASIVYHPWGISHSEIPCSLVLRELGLRK